MRAGCSGSLPITKDRPQTRHLAEDEVGIQPSETVMNVPHDLVSKVRELIAKQHD